MRSKLALALALLGATGTSGCVTAAVAGAAGVGLLAAQQRPFGQGLDDASASTDIKSKMLRTDARGFSGIDVRVVDGRALLVGTTPSAEFKSEAERLAWTVPQIRAVANEIDVGQPGGIARGAMDDALSARVRARLFADPTVRAVDVSVHAHKGVVYLMGMVASRDARDRAAQSASVVGGVTRVVSYIEVRETPTIRPARLRVGAPISIAGDTQR